MSASFNIPADRVRIITNTVMGFNNDSANIVFPPENPTGASPSVPFALTKVADGGPLVWSSIVPDEPAPGFDSILLYTNYVPGNYILTLYQMFPAVPVAYSGPLLLEVTMIGGGGGGASIYNPASSSGCGGGGGGATSIKYLRSPNIDRTTTFEFTVGAGGAGALGGNTPNLGANGFGTFFVHGTNIYGASAGEGGGSGAPTPNSVILVRGGAGGAITNPLGANTNSDIVIGGGCGGSGVYNYATASGSGGGTAISGSVRGPIQFSASTNYAGVNGNLPGGGGTGSWQNINSTAATLAGSGAPGGIIAKLWYDAS